MNTISYLLKNTLQFYMLKRRALRKLILPTALLFTLLLIYLIPKNEYIGEIEIVNNDIKLHDIYLVDKNNLVSLTKVEVNSTDILSLSKELLNILINDDLEKIPSGFKTVLNSSTIVKDITYQDNILKVVFNDKIVDVDIENEIKVIESIVYTLTSIKGIDYVVLYQDDKILTKLPKSGYNIPNLLNRRIGINKIYDTETLNTFNVTTYFIGNTNGKTYYIPVTKVTDNSLEKIEIVIEELSGNISYNTNLKSYLNSNTKLIEVMKEEEVLKLSFNEYIFSDINELSILEEVLYTISLSAYDNYDINDVIFMYNNEEIYKNLTKTIE